MAALLEVLPLQIPALRPSSPEAQGDRGPRAAPLPGRGGSGGGDAPATVPYVKLCGLRLPESFTPYVDDQKDAQVCTPCYTASPSDQCSNSSLGNATWRRDGVSASL